MADDRDDILGGGQTPDPDRVPDQEPSGRGASVRLRDSEGGRTGPRMDPANQSLADALRFTYGLLRFVMVVLVVLFVLSGSKTIREGERGISVAFGRPVAQNLSPGWQLVLPYPMGELIRVGEGTVEVKIARAFMPYTSRAKSEDEAMALKADEFTRDSKLKPGRSGSNITADLNIAHTQWTVNFRRTSHERWASTVLPEQESALVRGAVQRGVVHALSGVGIDDLLKQSGDAISARVRDIAQRSLDEAGAGITIDRVVLGRKVPPISLLDRFSAVQSSAQNAAKAREDALLTRDQRLNQVAGRAAPALIDLINEYEELVELGRDEDAERVLATIDAVLEGRPADVGGQVLGAGLVAGEVASVINEARGRVSTMVSQAIADRDYFRAKLTQYESNPRLMIARDWSGAMTSFMGKDFVQAMMLPEGVTAAELLISEDPELVKSLASEKKRQQALEALERRQEEQRHESFRSRRGIEDKGE